MVRWTVGQHACHLQAVIGRGMQALTRLYCSFSLFQTLLTSLCTIYSPFPHIYAHRSSIFPCLSPVVSSTPPFVYYLVPLFYPHLSCTSPYVLNEHCWLCCLNHAWWNEVRGLGKVDDFVRGNAINRTLGTLWPLMGCSFLIIDRHWHFSYRHMS